MYSPDPIPIIALFFVIAVTFAVGLMSYVQYGP